MNKSKVFWCFGCILYNNLLLLISDSNSVNLTVYWNMVLKSVCEFLSCFGKCPRSVKIVRTVLFCWDVLGFWVLNGPLPHIPLVPMRKGVGCWCLTSLAARPQMCRNGSKKLNRNESKTIKTLSNRCTAEPYIDFSFLDVTHMVQSSLGPGNVLGPALHRKQSKMSLRCPRARKVIPTINRQIEDVLKLSTLGSCAEMMVLQQQDHGFGWFRVSEILCSQWKQY